LHTAVAAAVLAALVKLARGGKTRALVPQSIALGLTALDFALAQSGLILFAPSEDWRGAPAIVESLPPGPDNYRIFRQLGPLPTAWSDTRSDTRYVECLEWDRQTLSPKYPLPLRLAFVEASSPIVPAEYRFLLEGARKRTSRGEKPSAVPTDEVLDLLAARVAIVPDSSKKSAGFPSLFPRDESPAASAKPITQPTRRLPMGSPSEDMVAYLRPSALPRAWIVHQVKQLPVARPRSEKALKQLTNEVLFSGEDSRDWRQIAVVETDEPIEPTIESAASDARESCEITYADPLRVELEVRLQSAGLVVLGDLFYPGWELLEEISGLETPHRILRTNRVQRGVALAAGQYHLIFRYRPKSVWVGALVSCASIVGLSLAGAVHLVRRRRPRSNAKARADAAQI
jgi:hypothetical protein